MEIATYKVQRCDMTEFQMEFLKIVNPIGMQRLSATTRPDIGNWAQYEKKKKQ